MSDKDTVYRQAAIDAINSHFGFNIEEEYGSAVQEVINGLPSAQSERKKGKWISKYNGKPVKVIKGFPQESCFCSVCGKWLIASDEYGVIGNYCPNCGARMEEESDGGNS